jgi:Bacterial conjugation TrbI-like protein
MLSNKAAVAAIGVVALVGASAAGAYLASRHTEPSAQITQGTEATEAVIEDQPTASAPPPAVEPVRVATPTPAKPVVRPASQTPRGAASERQTRQVETVPAPQAPRPVDTQDRVVSQPPTPEPVETVPVTDVPVARDDRRPTEQAPLPTLPQFEEVTVPAEAVIGLQLASSVSSDTARVEDRVEARVTRDVRAGGRVAIPAGSRVLGSVSVVERGGKMRERARLGVRFHTVILADGTELALQTETVLREGESPANASAAKVGGGAIGGAILGAILGGGKGAAIGAGVGAGAGTAAVMAGGRKPAQIQAGSPMTVKVLSPVTVSVEK